MTMGQVNDIDGFKMMHELKQKVIEEFKFDESQFILSMGTSADFENAVSKFINLIINRQWRARTKSEWAPFFSGKEITQKRRQKNNQVLFDYINLRVLK